MERGDSGAAGVVVVARRKFGEVYVAYEAGAEVCEGAVGRGSREGEDEGEMQEGERQVGERRGDEEQDRALALETVIGILGGLRFGGRGGER